MVLDPTKADPACLAELVCTAMPFGKYKGRMIADLPSSYLAWFARQGVPRGRLGQLLITMQAIDENGLRYLLEPLKQARDSEKGD